VSTVNRWSNTKLRCHSTITRVAQSITRKVFSLLAASFFKFWNKN
jgi:hypothetical protein